MFTAELITTLGGMVAGFVMRLIAIRSQQQTDFQMAAIGKINAATESADRAAARTKDGGKFARRLIVLFILFSVVLVPLLAPMWGLPVVVEHDKKFGTLFFGLIELPSFKQFTTVYGVLLIPELRQVLLAIVGFYFGAGSARAR